MALRTDIDLDFLVANIHGRRSRLAEGDRLDELCRLRSVADLSRALYPASGFLAAAHLQRILVLERVEELSAIASKLGGTPGAFLDWLRVRYQMENLKVLVRGFANGMSLERLQPHLVPLPGDLALDLEVLARAGTIEAFAEVVPAEPLREGVRMAVELYHDRPRPFFVETGLDHAYLAEQLARAGRLPRAHRDDVLGIVRQETDTFHMMLAARGRLTFGLGRKELLRFHVPGAGLGRPDLAAMLEADSARAIAERAEGHAIDAAPPVPGGDASARVDLGDLEDRAWRRYWRLANRTFRRAHMGLGAVVAYAAIRRVELANLIRLSEGIRTRLEPRAIRRRLIPPADMEGARV